MTPTVVPHRMLLNDAWRLATVLGLQPNGEREPKSMEAYAQGHCGRTHTSEELLMVLQMLYGGTLRVTHQAGPPIAPPLPAIHLVPSVSLLGSVPISFAAPTGSSEDLNQATQATLTKPALTDLQPPPPLPFPPPLPLPPPVEASSLAGQHNSPRRELLESNGRGFLQPEFNGGFFSTAPLIEEMD